MKITKRKLRILTFLLILMFLLIPFLSSPAAAAVNHNAGSGTTINNIWPTASTATVTMNANLVVPPLALPPLTITFSYSFQDRTTTGPGSSHTCTMTVTRITPPASPPGPWIMSTGATPIAPGGTSNGVLVINIMFPAAPRPLVYSISVTISVTDLNVPGNGFTSTTGPARTVTLT